MQERDFHPKSRGNCLISERVEAVYQCKFYGGATSLLWRRSLGIIMKPLEKHTKNILLKFLRDEFQW